MSSRTPVEPEAFERYYADAHTALASALPGLQRFESARVIATPDVSATASCPSAARRIDP